MELLATIRRKDTLNKVINIVDGVIIGKYFTTGYDDFSYEEIREIRDLCRRINKKFFIEIENFISEEEIPLLDDYFSFIYGLGCSGIIFHDFGVYQIAKEYELDSLLIYDGKSVMCNSLDSYYLLNKEIDSIVLSRELTLDEIYEIVRTNVNRISLQIFGHLRMSYSKRKFLTNYFKEVNKEYDYINSKSLYLIEEKRDYKMPIIEDESGTKIYTDYVFEMYEELPKLEHFLRYGIIDTLFLDDELITKVCVDLHNISKGEALLRRSSLYANMKYEFSSGYLYNETNITKDE